MTTGEYLVANSPLPSGTALAHFMALQFGAGQGETVFASRFCVVTGDERIEVTQRAKKQAPQPMNEQREPRSIPNLADDKRAFAFFSQPSVIVTSRPDDEIYITSKQLTAIARHSLEQTTINRKRGQK